MVKHNRSCMSFLISLFCIFSFYSHVSLAGAALPFVASSTGAASTAGLAKGGAALAGAATKTAFGAKLGLAIKTGAVGAAKIGAGVTAGTGATLSMPVILVGGAAVGVVGAGVYCCSGTAATVAAAAKTVATTAAATTAVTTATNIGVEVLKKAVQDTVHNLQKEDEKEGDRDVPQFMLLKAAVVKSDCVTSSSESRGATFDLPGGTIPVSCIQKAEGLAHSLASIAVIGEMNLPGIGAGGFIMDIHGSPVTTAQHKHGASTQSEPHVYPPYQKGDLFRLRRINIPGFGKSDIVFFVPNGLKADKTCTERLVLGAGGGAAKPQAKPEALLKAAAPAFVGPILAAVGGSGGAVTLGALTGTPVAVVGAPLIIGGTAMYCTIKFFKERNAFKRAQLEYEEKMRQNGGCGSTTPINPDKPTGFAEHKPELPLNTAHNNPPFKVETTTGCGNTQPMNIDVPTGCGSTQPMHLDDLVTQRLIEQDVKAKFGNVLDDICKDKIGLDVDQIGLDHTTEGHLDGAPLVHKNPNRPKTLFNNEQEIPDLMVETIQKGTVSQKDQVYEYDFGRPIGKTVTGKPLHKVRVVVRYNHQTGKNRLISMYPIE